MLQRGAAGADHDNSENGYRQNAGYAGHGVVDARGGAGAGLVDGAYDDGGQRSDADGHAQTENHEGGKEGQPITAADGRQSEQKEACRGDERPNDKRELRTEAGHESA